MTRTSHTHLAKLYRLKINAQTIRGREMSGGRGTQAQGGPGGVPDRTALSHGRLKRNTLATFPCTRDFHSPVESILIVYPVTPKDTL